MILEAAVFFSNATGTCGGIGGPAGVYPIANVSVQARDTVHLTFPQPFLSQAPVGPYVCLVARLRLFSGPTGLVGPSWSAVGYKF